jgi:hypothetical protein
MAIALTASLLLPGCGFVLREEAIPEQLPTTTRAPSALPEGANPTDDAAVLPPPVFEPPPESAAPAETVPQTVPDDSTFVDRQELESLVTSDAPAVCRSGAALAYWSGQVLAASLDPLTGQPVDQVDEGFVQRSLTRAVDALEVVVPQIDASDALLPNRRRVDAAVDDLRRTAQQPDPATPLALQFRDWWNSHGNDLTGIISGLGVLCQGQPFTKYLGQWR